MHVYRDANKVMHVFIAPFTGRIRKEVVFNFVYDL